VLKLTIPLLVSVPATDRHPKVIEMSSELEQRSLTYGQGQWTAYTETRSTVPGEPLNEDELDKLTKYFNATLYLCLGMLYLK
jgi:xylulose-5-phosphate/fructose-6-phosphate phosphoketolase